MNGVWTILDVKGGDAPTAREGSTLFVSNWRGSSWLTIIGGVKPTFGLQRMQVFTFEMDKAKSWHKVELGIS